MKRFSGSAIALYAIILTVVAGAGIGIGALLFTDETPESLQEAAEITVAPVTQRSFDDQRNVEVALTFGADTTLTAPSSGRITSFSCLAGDSILSGKTNLSINGQAILNLSTSVPLWRDISLGARGDDIASLQIELARLGYNLESDGIVGSSTLTAVTDLFHELGDDAFATGTIPNDRILWLPEPETTVATCTAAIGADISDGDEIAALPGGLADAAITHLPDDLVEGGRVLALEGKNVIIGADGRVTDSDALEGISETALYEQALRSDANSITGTYALSEPVTVSVVPPGAL